jgi:hypothetical protein
VRAAGRNGDDENGFRVHGGLHVLAFDDSVNSVLVGKIHVRSGDVTNSVDDDGA